MPIGGHYRELIAQLNNIYELNEARAIAGWVMEHLLNWPVWKIRDSKEEFKAAQMQLFSEYTGKLLQHVPVQYVLQEAWFYRLSFYVNEHVLIPRPETEELVDWVLKDRKPGQPLSILDIGTGSGCIPVLLKRERPKFHISALDCDLQTLAVARRNAAFHQAEIAFYQMDFLNEDLWHTLSDFDVLISNPPYIPLNEKEMLDRHVRDFEPGVALFVPQNEPLIFYKKLALFGKWHLKTNGAIYAEIHRNFSAQVAELFTSNGYIVEMKKDIFGNDRMIKVY